MLRCGQMVLAQALITLHLGNHLLIIQMINLLRLNFFFFVTIKTYSMIYIVRPSKIIHIFKK